MKTVRLLGVLLMVGACGGGGGDDSAADGAVGGDDAAVALVPDPGSGAIPFSWPDTEPNDTPEQAVPLGTSVSNGEATWFDGTAESGSLGGSDTADYFVFRSSSQGGVFHAGPCWDGTSAPNLMDFYVYQVVGGHVGTMVGSAVTSDASCENIDASADVTMQPDTVYLVELRMPGSAPVTLYGA